MATRVVISALRHLDGTKSFASVSYWSGIIACGSSVAATTSGQPMFMTATVTGVVVSTVAQFFTSVSFNDTAETLRQFVESRAQCGVDQADLPASDPKTTSSGDLS